MKSKAKIHENLSLTNLDGEIWKDIPNYIGYYQCSNLGRIKSLKRKGVTKNRIKKQQLNKGYLNTRLNSINNIKIRVHQLVAITFLNHIPCGHKFVIDHIDGDKLNNNLKNLQITTNRHNLSKDKIGYSSKYVGVSLDKRTGKFTARIRLNKKHYFLGYFDLEIEAHEKYQEALSDIESGCFLSKRK